jgi:hypothetical protein
VKELPERTEKGERIQKYALDYTEDKKLGRTDFPSYLIVETGKQSSQSTHLSAGVGRSA